MALLNVKTAEDFYALLQRLYGSTYGSNIESSIFQRQLRSWAVLLAHGHDEIDRAFRQAFPDLSDALIEEWEHAYNLPNDSARTLAERQARVAAHERTQRGAARDDMQATLDTTGTTVAFITNRRDEVVAAGSEDEAIFQSTLQLANEDFFDPIVRDAVETLFGNALPAKNVGALDRPGPGQSTCVEVGAQWASSTHYVGRDAIARQVLTPRTERAPHDRVRNFGPGTRIDAADLNAIQETLLGAPLVGHPNVLSYVLTSPGIVTRWVATSTAGVHTIDSSIDWRDRIVVMCVQHSGVRNLRPGQADDDKYGVPDTSEYICVYTGPGGYLGWDALGTTISIQSTVGGVLQMNNVSTRHIVGVVWGTEKLGMR